MKITPLAQALKYLSVRPRSEQEVVNHLSAKKFSSEDITATIDRLKRSNLLDDAEFASWMVSSRSRSKPMGNRRLVSELKAKGVDSPQVLTSQQETELAQVAIAKKFKGLPLVSREDQQKAMRFLQYRGFSWTTIEKVVKNRYNDD